MGQVLSAMVIFGLLFCSILASAQTKWPNYVSGLEPELSESAEAAVVPPDVVVQPPDTNLTPDKARWSGNWSGWACLARMCDIKLIVEKVNDQGATIVYASASAARGLFSERLDAKFNADELQGTLASGSELAFRMRNDGVLEFSISAKGGGLAAGVLSQNGTAFRLVERVPTSFFENGKPITLEVVIYKPPGTGPFPTVIFNHGSTGNGDNPKLFASTWTSPALAKFFTDRGWLVAFPQRRGRGKSDGLYDEGFEQNRSGYSSRPELSLPGLERALTDLDATVDYLLARPGVDSSRMLMGGQSRGGILSVAYAGTRPARFMGVINFVGGWISDHWATAEAINTVTFKRGASYPKPILWLYGENDSFYKIVHSRKNFEAFVADGGKGIFKVFETPAGQNGHSLISKSALWSETVETYLKQIDSR